MGKTLMKSAGLGQWLKSCRANCQSLGVKLAFYFLLAGLVPLLVVGFVSQRMAENALTQEAAMRLTAVVDMRTAQISDAMDGVLKDAQLMARNPFVIQAYNDLDSAVDIAIDGEFIGSGNGEFEAPQLYQLTHDEVGDALKAYAVGNGYDDIYLIRPDEGQIIYSAKKDSDFGTEIGETVSPLHQVWAAALESRVEITDTTIYDAKDGQAFQFVAAPIMQDDEVLGVLAIRLAPAFLSSITQERAGLGDTGEVYIVGSDGIFRSNSNREGEEANRVTSSLAQQAKVNSEVAALAAKVDEHGHGILKGRRGESVLASYAPLKVGDNVTWNVIAEIHESEALVAANRIYYLFVGVISLGAIIIMAMGFLLAARITKPILRAAEFAKTMASGDLSRRMDTKGLAQDEVGMLANSLNETATSLADIIQQICTSSTTLSDSSRGLSDTANQLADGAETIKEQSGDLASASDELKSNIQHVNLISSEMSQNMRSISHSVDEMQTSIGEVASSADRTACVTDKTASLARTSNDKVLALGQTADQIEKVIGLIQDIAEQTNLLALNATIEAARAGEAGAGFAVVADEVKGLARQTANATNDIRGQIEAIQLSTTDVIDAIAEITTAINEINSGARMIAGAVEEQRVTTQTIANRLKETADSSEQVASNVSKSAELTSGIAENVQRVHSSIRSSAEGATKTKDASDQLIAVVSNQEEIVSRFRVQSN